MATIKTLIILIAGLLLLPDGDDGADLPEILNPGRLQLLKDALGWMTFRKDGVLLTEAELEPLFFEHLKEQYKKSKYYRTFMIAFEHTILPQLTLQENDACNPRHTLAYKDPSNGSVTYDYQKRFVFKSYDQSYAPQLCDYRQGLICKWSTSTCQCPQGSSMQPISPSSSIRRCVLHENEVCGLIDLAHGRDPKHSRLRDNLHHLIFNLEKPLSCQHGTQCRFKITNENTPLCYKNGPWHNNPRLLKFGEECVIDLYAEPGSCKTGEDLGSLEGYACYNFGPPRSLQSSGSENRTGFCAMPFGPFGITQDYDFIEKRYRYDTFFSPFIHPRTVPLRGKELEDYMRRYVGMVQSIRRTQKYTVGHPCSVSKTAKWEAVWKYYSSLEKHPPPGQDYVPEATKVELNAKMDEVSDLVKGRDKMCQVFYDFWDTGGNLGDETRPNLKCVPSGSSDADGNDGTCQGPGNLIDTLDHANRRRNLFITFQSLFIDQEKESKDQHREKIARRYPEGQCTPGLAPVPQTDSSVLEGGYCPRDHVCYDDYSEYPGVYTSWCAFQDNPPKLNRACLYAGSGVRLGQCEILHLNERATKEFEKLGEIPLLGRREPCRYHLERDIRDWLERGDRFGGNRYATLAGLEMEQLSGGICDASRLLKCTEYSGCQCKRDALEPRRRKVDGTEYESDYCYYKNCPERWRYGDEDLAKSEKDKILEHYGSLGLDRCDDKNMCVFWDSGRRECTTEYTGETGYDLEPLSEPPATWPPWKPNPTSEPSYEQHGGSGRVGGDMLVVIIKASLVFKVIMWWLIYKFAIC